MIRAGQGFLSAESWGNLVLSFKDSSAGSPWPGQDGASGTRFPCLLGTLQGDALGISLALHRMTPAVYLYVPRAVFFRDMILITPQLASAVI